MTFLLVFFSFFFSGFIILIFGQIVISLMTMGFFRGPFYTPTDEQRLINILKLAKLKSTDQLIDLGAGDGRIVVAAAKAGARATGIEINPIYFCRARRNLRLAGLTADQARIIFGDFWHHDLSAYSVVVIYGIGYMMQRLSKKLARELKPGTRVISIYFKLPGWQMLTQEGDVCYYIVPDSLPKSTKVTVKS